MFLRCNRAVEGTSGLQPLGSLAERALFIRSLYSFPVAGSLVCFLQLGDSLPILKHGPPHFVVVAMPTIASDAFVAAAAFIEGEPEACCTSACVSSGT